MPSMVSSIVSSTMSSKREPLGGDNSIFQPNLEAAPLHQVMMIL